MSPTFSARLLIILLVWALCSCFSSQKSVAAEPLWYTVQSGSFKAQVDAEKFYNVLVSELPPSFQADLRVEYISPYYTVRVGKFTSRQSALPLFETIKKWSPRPLIIHAFVRDTRIIHSFSSGGADKISDPAANPPSESVQQTVPPENIPGPIIIEKTAPVATEPIPPTDIDLLTPAGEIELQFYTVQVGTFTKEQDPVKLYQQLAEKLPPAMRDFLRIEKISSFFTVRVGKAQEKEQLSPLFLEVKKYTANPMIIYAFLHNSRVVQSYTEFHVKTQTPLPEAAPQISPGEKPPQTPVPQPDTVPYSSPGRDKEPEAAPVRPQITETQRQEAGKKKLLEITPSEKSPPQKEKVIERPAQKSPAISNEEYEKILFSRYLDTDAKAKDTAKAKKKTDTFKVTANCTTTECHGSIKNIQEGHYPAKKEKCFACHTQKNDEHPGSAGPEFQINEEGASLCSLCHLDFASGRVTHSPAKEGECLQCHSPHGSGKPYLLPVEKNSEQLLCQKCHDDNFSDLEHIHGPVGLGRCTFCHNPHASEQNALLREEPTKLCITCHAEFIKGLDESPFVHSTVREKGCLSCHAPHGSNFPNLLISEPQSFCFSCHPDVEKKFYNSRSKHSGLYLDKQCGTCHVSHYSQYKALLINNEMDLCLGCHGPNPAVSSYSPKNIAREIERKEYIHGPIANKNCTGCHSQHGSQNDYLLKGQYPSSFYLPYDPDKYELCFLCHDKELLTAPQTSNSTNFRNGDQNLHFVHVAIEKKGRTCRSCHSSHASDGPKLINRSGAAFGTWTMSIAFSLTETGGSCTPGCHRELSYDRSKPADYTIKEDKFEKPFIDYSSK